MNLNTEDSDLLIGVCSNKIPYNHALLYSKILQIEYTSTACFAVLTAQIIVSSAYYCTH